MDYEVSGLPMHILLVHGTVVFVPLAALCTALSILWPAARRRLGITTVVLALLALVMVPVTQAAGEWLMMRVDTTTRITEHVLLGKAVLPWVIALFLVALAQWLWYRYAGAASQNARERLGRTGVRAAGVVIALAVLVVCGGTVLAVLQAGETGSRAVWEGSFSQDPLGQ